MRQGNIFDTVSLNQHYLGDGTSWWGNYYHSHAPEAVMETTCATPFLLMVAPL
jgi:hypothetical protein